MKKYVSAVVTPFAAAATALLLVLSFLEFWRRGFVSLFLDLRLVVVAVLVLWVAAVLTRKEATRRGAPFVLIALLALVPVLWALVSPFGRLGLIVFAAGLATMAIVFFSTALTTKNH